MKGWFNQWFSRFNLSKRKQKPVTYFVHVPKTAGTSFIVLLDRFFSANTIFPQQLWREINHIEKSLNKSYDLYRGHLGGGGLKVLTNRPIEYLTILRSPIDLAQSTYEYVLREQNTKVHHLVKDSNMSFDEFICHATTQPLIKNRMVRNLSFDFKEDPAAQEVFLSAETIVYLQAIMSKTTSSLNDEHRLSRAKKLIDNSRWYGLQERFDESMQLLCFVMHWPPIGPSQKLNTFIDKTVLADSTKENLTMINQQDMALYRYASSQFDVKYQNMLTALEKLRTQQAQSIDDLLDVNYQQLNQSVLCDGINYDFGQVLFGGQWHRRELMQPENEFFRWTGPKHKAHIDFWLKAQKYQITIRIINAVSIEALDKLQIKLNGKPINWQTEDQGVVRVLRLSCSAELIQHNGLVRLSFEVPKVMSHQTAFESDDQRLVGIAVHWIQFNHD